MIDTGSWTQELRHQGYRFASGVPCSSLSPLQNEILNDPDFDYIAATNEGQAIALASGAWTGGASSVVLMQNSGLGNAVNPLASLTEIFRIPVLLVISWRGQPGIKDEPQHQLMGAITPHMLDTLRIPHLVLDKTHDTALHQLRSVCADIRRTGQTHAIIVPDKTFEPVVQNSASLKSPQGAARITDLRRQTGAKAGRADILRHLVSHPKLKDALRIATTGKTGRELFTLGDTAQNLYMVGSMGLASSFGLGLSRQTNRTVLVIDGDGAAMMHMGALATIGHYGSGGLKHLIIDNGCYDSTGGQITNSASVDFAAIAASCGYAKAYRVDDMPGLSRAMSDSSDGPVAIHMAAKPGSMSPLGRPDVTPEAVLRRLQNGLHSAPTPTPAREVTHA